MTRRTYPNNMLENSADADGDAITVSHIGVHPAAALIDWSTTPYVRADLMPGTLEFYPNGTVIHDDGGVTTSNPPGGSSSTPVEIGFRVSDGTEYSTGVNKMSLTLTGALSGDVIAPTFVDMVPAVGSAGNSETTDIQLNYSEALQEGTGTFDLYNVGTGILIESFAVPGDIGMGEGQLYISGSSVIINPTGTLASGIDVSVRVSVGAVQDLAGNDCAAITGDALAFATNSAGPSAAFPDDPDGWRGQEATFAYPTTGDHIVDATGAGDFTTLTAAVAAATAGQTIRVKDTGVYREAFTYKSDLTVTGWGTDRPLVSAQEPVTGFVQCTAGDAAVLGSVLGVASSPVYKKTGIASSATSATLLVGLNVMEDHVPLFPSSDRANPARIWSQEDESLAHDAAANGGSILKSGTTVIGVNDPTVITAAKYTDAQLLAAKVRIIVSPNEYPIQDITAANVAGNSITVAGGRTQDGSGRTKYAIVNVGPAMVAGTYFTIDNGTTFDLYVYPLNPANIDKISIAARAHIITLPDSGANMYIGGMDFEGASGDGTTEGSFIRDVSNGNTTTGLTVERCKARGFVNLGYQHAAALHLIRSDDATIQYNTFEDCNAHGIFPNGSLVTQNNVLQRRNVFKRCGSAGSKAYRTSYFMFLHNYHEDCGFRAHGNLGNVYISGDRPLWWGNTFVRCQGYFTAQNITNPCMAYNWAPCDSKYNTAGVDLDNRKLVMQGATGTFYCFNNSLPVVIDGVAPGGHLALYPDDSGLTAFVYNNEAHGIITPGDAQGTVNAEYNLNTHDGYSGSTNGNLGPEDFVGGAGKFSTTNVHQTDLAVIYTDYASGDYSPVNGSSPLVTMSTFNMTTIVAALKAAYPLVPIGDWDIDAFGNAITHAASSIGANQNR